MHTDGKLPPLSEKLLFSDQREAEELYDYVADPFQITNLSSDTKFKTQLERNRERLDQWMEQSRDKGAESDAMYDSDMAEYVKKPNPEVERNIALMKQWAKEGK